MFYLFRALAFPSFAYRKQSNGCAAVTGYRSGGSGTEVWLPGPYGSEPSRPEHFSAQRSMPTFFHRRGKVN